MTPDAQYRKDLIEINLGVQRDEITEDFADQLRSEAMVRCIRRHAANLAQRKRGVDNDLLA